MYFKEAEEIRSASYCIISDCLRHDTIAVLKFLGKLINSLRITNVAINHVHYFSDGSAARYKNFKNFANLCNRQKDFTSRLGGISLPLATENLHAMESAEQ